MKKEIKKTEFEFIDEKSAKGTALKYIKFNDNNFRLSTTQKETLKEICKGYFFYSKSKKMWGFTNREYNELNVYNFIAEGSVPEDITEKVAARNIEIKKEPIPFKIEDFEIKFIELSGRPLFYHENNNGVIEININLKHWFFEKKDEAEKEFAKKIILSLVGTEMEYTSQLLENYFIKLNSIQENLKYTYGRCK